MLLLYQYHAPSLLVYSLGDNAMSLTPGNGLARKYCSSNTVSSTGMLMANTCLDQLGVFFFTYVLTNMEYIFRWGFNKYSVSWKSVVYMGQSIVGNTVTRSMMGNSIKLDRKI